MFQRVLRRAAITRYRQVLSASMVVPRDAPVALSGQPGALRVLVLGSGVASGQGVGTYGLALVGALQRSLQRRLGRPVDVELVRQHGAGIEHAAAIAEDRIGEDWDAYVLAFGVSDALQLTPAPVWRRGLGLLLSTIEDRKASPFRVPVLVAGIPPLSSFDAHRGPLMPALARHATALDRVTRRMLVGHGGARFVPLPTMQAAQAGRFGSPSAYEGWAEVLAEQLVPMLRLGPTRVADRHEDAHPDVPALLAAMPPATRDRLRRVASEARQALGGDFAAVRLVHGDRLIVVADSVGTDMRSTPLAGSICMTTLDEGIVLSPDVTVEARFAALTGMAAHGIRSYAGVVLRDASGVAIGTLCVLGGGAGRDGQESALRRLGRAAEHELGDGPASGPAEARPLEPRSAVGPVLQDDGPALDEAALPSWRQRMRLRRTRTLRSERSRLVELPAERSRPALRSFSIPGPDPLWLLVLGGEYAVGYGVGERAQALDGQLARLLHRRTGRGVEVHNCADDRLSLRETSLQLGPRGAEGYDLVIWTPRFTDAARPLWRAAWVFGVSSLIRYVQATSQAQVVVMGFPALIGHQPLAALGRARARRLNQLFHLIAARFAGTWVAEPSPVVLKDVEDIDGAAVYRAAAVHMFATVFEALHTEDRGHEDVRPADDPVADDAIEPTARRAEPVPAGA